MTINKSQGQTLNYVGISLTESVFTHGQLYVAISRVTNGVNLRMIVPDTDDARREGKIKNVVYTEVFNWECDGAKHTSKFSQARACTGIPPS